MNVQCFLGKKFNCVQLASRLLFPFCRLTRGHLPSRSVEVWKHWGAAWGQWGFSLRMPTQTALACPAINTLENTSVTESEPTAFCLLAVWHHHERPWSTLQTVWEITCECSHLQVWCAFYWRSCRCHSMTSPLLYLCVQRFIIGVFGRRDHSSGVSTVGGRRPDVQGEARQGSGSAVCSDRLVSGTTCQHGGNTFHTVIEPIWQVL